MPLRPKNISTAGLRSESANIPVILTKMQTINSTFRKSQAAFNPYSKERMKRYTEQIMGNKIEITASAFPVLSKNDVLALTAAVAYAEENGFDVETGNQYISAEANIAASSNDTVCF